jgi:hypothetical protein
MHIHLRSELRLLFRPALLAGHKTSVQISGAQSPISNFHQDASCAFTRSELAKATDRPHVVVGKSALGATHGIRLRETAFLRRRSCGFAKRHVGADGRAMLGLRVDGKLPIQQLQPLRHADKAKPMGVHCPSDVKSGPRIAHGEANHIRSIAQLYIEVPHTAVLHGILQSFLQDAEEAEGNLLRKCAWDLIMSKDDLDILLVRELFAECTHGTSNAQILQF